jgi:enoyl-CoA hydratase/carnithine racemase
MIEVRDGIATVCLANPRRRNAISTGMWRDLGMFAAEVATHAGTRVVIIRGDGDVAFSGGADISDFASGRANASQGKEYDDLVEQTCRAVEAIPQPTIALIKGPCMGAGASLAASCDMRVAADDAFFAVPAAKLGLGYDPRGVARFIRVFGANNTRALLYTADRLPASRAHALGAVHALAPAAGLEESVDALARRIAANAPLTIKAAKLAIRALTVDRDAVLLTQAEALASAADGSADYVEGRRAFAEKRSPRFSRN